MRLHLLARGDVDHKPVDEEGKAACITLAYTPALQNPAHLAVVHADAVLDVIGLALQAGGYRAHAIIGILGQDPPQRGRCLSDGLDGIDAPQFGSPRADIIQRELLVQPDPEHHAVEIRGHRRKPLLARLQLVMQFPLRRDIDENGIDVRSFARHAGVPNDATLHDPQIATAGHPDLVLDHVGFARLDGALQSIPVSLTLAPAQHPPQNEVGALADHLCRGHTEKPLAVSAQVLEYPLFAQAHAVDDAIQRLGKDFILLFAGRQFTAKPAHPRACQHNQPDDQANDDDGAGQGISLHAALCGNVLEPLCPPVLLRRLDEIPQLCKLERRQPVAAGRAPEGSNEFPRRQGALPLDQRQALLEQLRLRAARFGNCSFQKRRDITPPRCRGPQRLVYARQALLELFMHLAQQLRLEGKQATRRDAGDIGVEFRQHVVGSSDFCVKPAPGPRILDRKRIVPAQLIDEISADAHRAERDRHECRKHDEHRVALHVRKRPPRGCIDWHARPLLERSRARRIRAPGRYGHFHGADKLRKLERLRECHVRAQLAGDLQHIKRSASGAAQAA